MSGVSFDWKGCERPYYTFTQIICNWCEIPSERGFKRDPKTSLPVSHPGYPIVMDRVGLLHDAINTGRLTSIERRMGPQRRDQRIVLSRFSIIYHEDLKRWFEQHQPLERPRFLFWKDDAVQNAALSNEAAAWWIRGDHWSSGQAAWLFSGCDPEQIDMRIDLTDEACTVLHQITHVRGPNCARHWDKWRPFEWLKAAVDAGIVIPDALVDGVKVRSLNTTRSSAVMAAEQSAEHKKPEKPRESDPTAAGTYGTESDGPDTGGMGARRAGSPGRIPGDSMVRAFEEAEKLVEAGRNKNAAAHEAADKHFSEEREETRNQLTATLREYLQPSKRPKWAR